MISKRSKVAIPKFVESIQNVCLGKEKKEKKQYAFDHVRSKQRALTKSIVQRIFSKDKLIVKDHMILQQHFDALQHCSGSSNDDKDYIIFVCGCFVLQTPLPKDIEPLPRNNIFKTNTCCCYLSPFGIPFIIHLPFFVFRFFVAPEYMQIASSSQSGDKHKKLPFVHKAYNIKFLNLMISIDSIKKFITQKS